MATPVAYIVLGVTWTIMTSTLIFHAWHWGFCYCMVLLESIISPVSASISIVPFPLHIIHIPLFPSYTLHCILHTFLVFVVSPCCRFTSEDWDVETTNEREILILILLVLVASFNIISFNFFHLTTNFTFIFS